MPAKYCHSDSGMYKSAYAASTTSTIKLSGISADVSAAPAPANHKQPLQPVTLTVNDTAILKLHRASVTVPLRPTEQPFSIHHF